MAALNESARAAGAPDTADDVTAAIPASTYRLQVNAGFTLQDAAGLLDYFAELGVGALYMSPILTARCGSTHGYDVVDHSTVNPEIAPGDSLSDLAAGLKRAGMGLIVDVVPNHMCIADHANALWYDVLENGPSSPQARFFDIDWRPPRENLADKVLLPILGDQYGLILENQEIQIVYSDGGFTARYWERCLPTAPRSWPAILRIVLEQMRETAGADDPGVVELESIITAIGYLPLRSERNPDRLRERQREKSVIRSRVAALVRNSETCADAIAHSIRLINGRKGDASSFDILESILADQAYRMSYWRVAADEINYRRFFDINELAAIRVEDPVVFDAVHQKLLECISAGWVTGLRIDHPDGLSDPVRYFRDLQTACGKALLKGMPQSDRPFYIVAEKVMVGDERPRGTWAVHGTTGYGFLNELNGLFVDPGAAKMLTEVYENFTGNRTSFTDLIYLCKRLILRVSLSSELNVLARRLDRICQQHRHTRDFTLDSLRFALREIISCFPVYRTYIQEDDDSVDEEDRRHIRSAIEQASARNPAVSSSVFDAIERILLLDDPPGTSDGQKAERRLFILRMQQLTGPVMAKGVEDTAFYRRYPLASLNEVGGDPELFGLAADAFHERIVSRQRQWPHNMVATSTHDTKRSEDVRARLNTLSEIPEEWSAALARWHAMNRVHRTTVDGAEAPDRNAEYLLYQTIIGTLDHEAVHDSGYVDRIMNYMEKALREAKVHTSWINPDTEYDAAAVRFVKAVLSTDPGNVFLEEIRAFTRSIARAGLMNALSQVAIKLTCPGVPDIYQGTEIWDFSLVDPDNRRPVDFAHRRRLIAGLADTDPGELLRRAEDGRVKLLTTQRLLQYRSANRQFFESAAYVPLSTFGDQREHAVSFARTTADRILLTVAGRFFVRLGCRTRPPVGDQVWQDSAVILPNDRPGLEFRDILTGSVVRAGSYRGRSLLPLSELFSVLPVAVLECSAES